MDKLESGKTIWMEKYGDGIAVMAKPEGSDYDQCILMFTPKGVAFPKFSFDVPFEFPQQAEFFSRLKIHESSQVH